MEYITIIEIHERNIGCGNCGDQKYHLVIAAERDSKRVRDILIEHLLDIINVLAWDNKKEGLIAKIDEMVDSLVNDYEEINLEDADTTINIINEDEWTTYFPARKKAKKKK